MGRLPLQDPARKGNLCQTTSSVPCPPMTLTTRQRLRVEVFELADNQCEHPAADGRCLNRAVEMAHIFARGMGHTGYRDTIDNVIAACTLHARSTDDLTSPEWDHVAEGGSFDRRTHLANYVNTRRRGEGWDV